MHSKHLFCTVLAPQMGNKIWLGPSNYGWIDGFVIDILVTCSLKMYGGVMTLDTAAADCNERVVESGAS